MRVEMPVVPQSLVESSKSIEKKEVTGKLPQGEKQDEELQSHFPTALGSSGTYSVSSLRAAVDYHAKFLTVAESNLQAAQHSGTIPQTILNRLNGQ